MMWGPGAEWAMPMFGGPLLLIVIVGIVIYYFTRRGVGPGVATPREILDRRFASGEISKEQYDQMKRDLAS